jgi:hypothetical protein
MKNFDLYLFLEQGENDSVARLPYTAPTAGVDEVR